MIQPVKLSDALVLDARVAGETFKRSITAQVEYWARLGQAIEPLLEGRQVWKLFRIAAAQPLSACIDSVDTPDGRRRVVEYLKSQPFPQYEPAPDLPGWLVRIEADGTRTVGRFVNRKFRIRQKKSAKR
jgi:hypothetical protein